MSAVEAEREGAGRHLRIALLTPTYWPEVRRGSERLAHDLSAALATRGHEVTLITSHPGPTRETLEDGVRVVRARRPPRWPRAAWYEYHLGNVLGVVPRLLRGRFDVVHAQFNTEAWAAVKARRLGGPPVVFACHGIVTRAHLVERRYRLEMMREAVRGAAATLALSAAAAAPLRRYLFARPQVLPGGVDLARFSVGAERAGVPTLICAASLGAPHKRGRELLAGFGLLRRHRPDVRLLLVRSHDPFLSRDPFREVPMDGVPEGVEWIDADETGRLARAYGSSWASVLPSVDEAFGLVLVESLAAGTPVVAARSGGAPEIVSDDAVGRLFEPDDPEDMARAMGDALDLGARSETAAVCRARAADYDWADLVTRYEELYERVVDA